ncbi:hypothetical protein [Salinimicrobium flavum]|uniref:Membrane or secreted protein n=1 Tax=Salinimicrobium flavum TaxID=1737065 RepID=A0ABW5IWX8_9FLAO
MKKLLILPLLFFFGMLSAQDLQGSWEMIEKNGEPVTDQETVKIYQDGYFAFGTKETGTNKFLSAGGGEYSAEGLNYIEAFDFYTADPEMVGRKKTYVLELEDDLLTLKKEDETEVWQKISDSRNSLSGNWVITGRKRDGEMKRSTPGARRTIKILGGDRFQWVAFNSDTREFSGTGGGTYTATDGVYTENIEFFSRDDSRVGAELSFDFEVVDDEWHHTGSSSKGDPIYEIWSPYNKAYTKK